jgi:hypothetical protein
MYRNDWFEDRAAIRALPLECVIDCSHQGDCDEDVSYWVDRLEFDGPAWLFREYLRGFGAWDRTDLCDHNENRKRVLWTWACSCADDPDAYEYLYLE